MTAWIVRAVERATSGSGRIPSLDGLRAISIAMVLFAHTSGTQYFPSFVFLRRNLGNLGVRVFFVISGFLITTLLINELRSYGRISLKQFYIRRFFRIFPAAYLYLAVMTLLTVGDLVGLRWWDLAHGFTYTVNYEEHRPWLTIHLWSLSVEEQFYLLWPAVLAVGGLARGWRVAVVVLVAAPVLRGVIPWLWPEWSWSVGTSFPTNADALGTGCLLALKREELYGWALYRRWLESPLFWVAPLLVLGISLGWLSNDRFILLAGQTLMNLGIVGVIDYFTRYPDTGVGRWLNRPLVVYVGVLSYSLYLWQEPFLDRTGGALWNIFPLNLMLTAVAALGSFYLVERPFLEMRKRFEPGAKAKRAKPLVER